MDILPKIQHFLWRAISGALPTYTRLCSRGINVDPTCQHCCLEEETINHVLFLCPHSYAIWRCSGLPVHNFQSTDLEANIAAMFAVLEHVDTSAKVSKLAFWVIWFIWKSRNEFLFNKRNVHPIEDAHRAMLANEEWLLNRKSPTNSAIRREATFQWEPPPSGWLKCNFDCSYRKEIRLAGVGWIVRNHLGVYQGSGTAVIQNVSSPLQGEAVAFLCAMQQIWIQGWRNVWFEGDSKELEHIINSVIHNNVQIGAVLYDLRHWMLLLSECSLECVNREKNMAADMLSNHSLKVSSSSLFFSVPPTWLIPFLYWPYTV